MIMTSRLAHYILSVMLVVDGKIWPFRLSHVITNPYSWIGCVHCL